MNQSERKERNAILVIITVAVLVIAAVSSMVFSINQSPSRSTVFSFQKDAGMMDLSDASYRKSRDNPSASTLSHVSTPPNLNILGLWSDWNRGQRLILWQDGDFRVTLCHMNPSSAGKEGGRVTSIYIRTDLHTEDAFTIYINRGCYFGLYKFNGIFPQPVDAKGYPDRSNDGWSTHTIGRPGNRKAAFEFYDTNLDFKDEGVYILAVELNFDVMSNWIYHKTIDFFTDPFAIPNENGDYRDNDTPTSSIHKQLPTSSLS